MKINYQVITNTLKRYKFLLISTLVMIILLVVYCFKDKSKHQASPEQGLNMSLVSQNNGNLVTTDSVPIEEMWRRSLEDNMNKHLESSNEKLDLLTQELASVKDQKPENALAESLSQQLEELTKELEEMKQHKDLKQPVENEVSKNAEISQYQLNLENFQNSKDYKPLKTADNYIPAGSFARGILLSGVDAATSINTAKDPEPILIKIEDYGTLPGRFRSDLKECHIVGAAYGDISSERVKVRLEKLSCMERKTGEVIETVVAGYVSGEDGRAGIRGDVVSKDASILLNSFFAGTLGGLSNVMNGQASSNKGAILVSDKVEKVDLTKKFRDGLALGASSGSDMLAKYYIQKAELLSPVIQIGAGIKVNVIFMEGVFIGTSDLKKRLAKERDDMIRGQSLYEVDGL